METNRNIEAVSAENRQQWRQWLENNSQSKTEICLILYSKSSEKPSVSYREAVEEALCFGWIDSLTNKRDAESRYQRFSPRKPKSNWSRSNIERVERLIRDGLMTESGQRMIDLAKQMGKWETAGLE
ncbi:YdeI/OmpD-associated family protein [Larkinella rosea]|uniref:Thymidylate synthase n=1 Tax=Larkinella rosea TaxID=2025312 RepID=A0A3P1BMX9_9BACT|nr:hypothetical protein [Larkinella rosea]RRB02419.1 hypothetical protein EHT25_18310 [Larkinella rosea]